MKRQYAVEITLTRSATRAELHRACRAFPLAANADRTRLMTVQRTKSPGRALRSLRHSRDRLLPIDTLTTHCPDPSGQVLLHVALSWDVCSTVRRTAADCGRRPADLLGAPLWRPWNRTETIEPANSQHR